MNLGVDSCAHARARVCVCVCVSVRLVLCPREQPDRRSSRAVPHPPSLLFVIILPLGMLAMQAVMRHAMRMHALPFHKQPKSTCATRLVLLLSSDICLCVQVCVSDIDRSHNGVQAHQKTCNNCSSSSSSVVLAQGPLFLLRSTPPACAPEHWQHHPRLHTTTTHARLLQRPPWPAGTARLPLHLILDD